MSTSDNASPVIGITIGDINGIGPEIIIKTLLDNRILTYLTPVIYGSTKTLSYYRKNYHLDQFNYSQVKNGITPNKVNVVNCWEGVVEINAGQSTEVAGQCSHKALERVVKDLKEENLDGVVTAPINKHNIQSENFNFVGHTEFFIDRFNVEDGLMLLVSDQLRIGVVTGHLPLKDVSDSITKELISRKLKLMEKSLIDDFGIVKPKIAVLGLNPHAGEEGLLGNEETEKIIPVIQDFKNNGKLVFGPFPADGFFGNNQQMKFDGVLAMYHDQGLIPFKSMAFESGINYTAGLPIVRTSPDHGTGFEIAGKNLASERSFREALMLCYDIIKIRKGLHTVLT